jgi:hypothetical protein
MADSAKPRDKNSGVGLAIIGTLLLFAGLLIVPPVFNFLLAGNDPIESKPAQAFAWGIGISLVSVGALFVLMRKRLSLGNILLTFVSLTVSLAVVEFALRILGTEPLAPFTWSVPDVAPSWRVSETGGGRYEGVGYDKNWRVNTQGFGDTDEFDADSIEGTTKRVLLLGDSFSFGVQASGDTKSFAALLENALGDEGVVWNTGIPGSGQKRALMSLREFGPVMKPQVVVLQFYENDFNDNLYPPGMFYLFENGKWVNRYSLQADGTVSVLEPDEAYLRAFGSVGLVSLLKSTSIVSSVLRVVVRRGQKAKAPMEMNLEPTRTALSGIRAECGALGASLIVLLVPDLADLEAPTKNYTAAVDLFEELQIEVVEVREDLTKSDYERPPKNHWIDSGHAIAGRAIAERVNQQFKILDERNP